MTHSMVMGGLIRTVRHLGGVTLPGFEVELDVESGDPHDIRAGHMIRLMLMKGLSDPGFRMIYELLAAGTYVIEGGYPCAQPCAGRHGPLAVYRVDDPVFPGPVLIWRESAERLLGRSRESGDQADPGVHAGGLGLADAEPLDDVGLAAAGGENERRGDQPLGLGELDFAPAGERELDRHDIDERPAGR
jgi:hypothetical protein